MDSTTPDSVDGAELTHARDVMTTSIISVGPDVPVREIATLLLDKRISAVPVVNNDGVPIGIVSEGDLVGRGERERLTRRDWWLAVIGGRQALDDKFAARLQASDRTASAAIFGKQRHCPLAPTRIASWMFIRFGVESKRSLRLAKPPRWKNLGGRRRACGELSWEQRQRRRADRLRPTARRLPTLGRPTTHPRTAVPPTISKTDQRRG